MKKFFKTVQKFLMGIRPGELTCGDVRDIYFKRRDGLFNYEVKEKIRHLEDLIKQKAETGNETCVIAKISEDQRDIINVVANHFRDRHFDVFETTIERLGDQKFLIVSWYFIEKKTTIQENG